MKPDEYETVSSRIAHALIESDMRMVWSRLATHAIVREVAGGLGMRIFEEMMLSVLLEVPTHTAHEYKKLHSPNFLV